MRFKITIESLWYSRSKFFWILLPFNLIFLALVKIKRALYQFKLFNSNRFNKTVLVVGNITVGGTGKTPFINQLVRILAQNKIKAGIVSRGYQSAIKNFPHQVIKSDTALDVGDEAFMQFTDLNCWAGLNIPMVIDPNRSRAIHCLIDNNDIDIVISDDGMQHYKMARDIEVLLFDGERQFGNQLILPFGPLREPVSRLQSADFIIQNGPQNNTISEHNVCLEAVKLVQLKTGKKILIEAFSKKKVTAVAGIGNPERFFNTLKSICTIENKKSFSDHYDFKLDDFESFQKDIIVMTEKDAGKCYAFAGDDWYYLKVEMSFKKTLTDRLLNTIKNNIEQKR